MRKDARPIAFVLKGWPRLSETFIANEIYALERFGLPLRLYALRHPTDRKRHPVHDKIAAEVTYLPEYLHDAPGRVFAAWGKARTLPGFKAALAAFGRDIRRDPSRNRIRRFGQAMVLAAELAPDTIHLHAHFLHTPASVARYAALMRSLPFSVSAHAKDIWTTPDWDKREKMNEAAFTVTCTRIGHNHLAGLARIGTTVHLAYHGLDLEALPDPPPVRPPRDGSDPGDPVRIVSIGRLVAKKGYDDLLDALASLPKTLAWRFDHAGGGPLADRLKRKARSLGLADRIRWHGPLAQTAIFELLRRSDLFVLACRIAPDGDRDGLPNALMEAMSQKLPCLSTRVSAIPELITDGTTGLLVAPNHTEQLNKALARAVQNPGLRARLGETGYTHLKAHFGPEPGLALLRQLFATQTSKASDADCVLRPDETARS